MIVYRRAIEHQQYWSTTICPADEAEERDEIATTTRCAYQPDAMTGVYVDGTEQCAACIAARDWNRRLLARETPAFADRRKQAQCRFVFGKNYRALRASPDAPSDPPFFCSRSGSVLLKRCRARFHR